MWDFKKDDSPLIDWYWVGAGVFIGVCLVIIVVAFPH